MYHLNHNIGSIFFSTKQNMELLECWKDVLGYRFTVFIVLLSYTS